MPARTKLNCSSTSQDFAQGAPIWPGLDVAELGCNGGVAPRDIECQKMPAGASLKSVAAYKVDSAAWLPWRALLEMRKRWADLRP